MKTFERPRALQPAGPISSSAVITTGAAGFAFADLREVLTVREVAAFLRVGVRTLYHAIRRGEFPVVRIGRRILIVKTMLAAFLDAEAAVERAMKTAVAERARRRAAGYQQFLRR